MNSTLPIRSILVATDLLPSSDTLIATAIELASGLGAEIHVLHAYEAPSAIAGGQVGLVPEQRALHERRLRLAEQVERASGASRVTSVRVIVGTPAEATLEGAARTSADLIILGPHRTRGRVDRYLGSTAERVLRSAEAPCLILNGALRVPMRQILVPSDQSAPARRALETALRWSGQLGEGPGRSGVTIVHVLDASVGRDAVSWSQMELHRELERSGEEARRATGVDVRVEADVLRSPRPAESLVGMAEEIDAQLVVMGTHSDTILVRALLGSVSSAMVRQSPVPILLVPLRAPPLEALPAGMSVPDAPAG